MSVAAVPEMPSFALYPQEVLSAHNGNCPPIETIHVNLGEINIGSQEILNPAQLRMVALGAVGLKDAQIAETLSYSVDTLRGIRLDAFDKLNAVNLPHAVTQCFRRGVFQVESQPDVVALKDEEKRLLRLLAEGQTVDEVGEVLGVDHRPAAWQIYQIRRKYDFARIPKAVLLGHMSGDLPLASRDKTSPSASEYTAKFTITPPSLMEVVTEEPAVAEGVSWQGGEIKVLEPTLLKPAVLQVLLLSTVGLKNAEIAAHTGTSIAGVRTYLKSAYRKLSARNRTHAVTQGFRQRLFGVARYIPPLDLTPREHTVLHAFAEGMPLDEREDSLGISPHTFNSYKSRVRRRHGNLPNMTAAVTKGYLSGDLVIKSRGTYAA